MRRVALACAVLLVALALFRLGGRAARARAPGFTPTATEERAPAEAERWGAGGPEAREAATAPGVRLLANGSVLLDGTAVSLNALGGACAGKGTVALRIDEQASWWHAEMVLGALQEAGVRCVRLDLPDGPVEIGFESEYWKQDARHLIGGHTAGVIAIESPEMDDPDLERKVAGESRRIETECCLRPLGEVVAVVEKEWPTFGKMSRGLRALRDADVEIELHFDWPDGELPDDARLPEPPEPPWSFTGHGPRCRCHSGFPAADLPVAMLESESPPEEYDRLFVHLDRAGRILLRTEMSLEELAAGLRAERDKYQLKMKQEGRTGVEEVAKDVFLSKLYVLVRADRAVPARQVGWILHVLAEEGFYKVQYATTREEAAPSRCVGTLDGRLSLFLPAPCAPGSLVGAHEPTVNVYVDPPGFGVEATGGLDAKGLAEAVRREAARADPERMFVIGLHVAAWIEWGRVVSALDAMACAGIGKVVFVDLPAPDAATRRAKPLPR